MSLLNFQLVITGDQLLALAVAILIAALSYAWWQGQQSQPAQTKQSEACEPKTSPQLTSETKKSLPSDQETERSSVRLTPVESQSEVIQKPAKGNEKDPIQNLGKKSVPLVSVWSKDNESESTHATGCIQQEVHDGGEQKDQAPLSKSEPSSSNPRPLLGARCPQLTITNFVGAAPVVVPPNSRDPIPIKNELFEGTMLLLFKTEPLDPAYLHLFEGKNRRLVMQWQGKFLQKPEGDLFVGAEITENMLHMGMVTR
jgi:hypothetical protein